MAIAAIFRRAHAKLNLRLEVGSRRNGLHPLVSLIASVRIADILRFDRSTAQFEVRCRGCEIPTEENLVWRAAGELGVPPPPVAITIRKLIPLQAGLGGGSADAAAALLGIAQILTENGNRISASAIFEAASRVGSDVPSALVPGVKVVAGTGDLVTPQRCRVPSWGILLLKPHAGSDTGRAYRLLDSVGVSRDLTDSAVERARAMCSALDSANFHDFLGLLHNDFSPVIEAAIPEVAAARKRVEQAGAAGVLLCGSGSCVAGFFESGEAARQAQKRVALLDGEWCAVTGFLA
jgi:4-diphosphocytidyl-2-C-methyl-D-erythritol kinase